MKKSIFWGILMLLLSIPMFVSASTFTMSGTDISLQIDDTQWYVFTVDNIFNNVELDDLGISYEYMKSMMDSNSVYLDAVLYDYEGLVVEVFVRKKAVEDVVNLSNFPDSEVMDLAKELAKQQGALIYDIYQTDYKFVTLNYNQESYNLLEYYTIVNGDAYTITAQTTRDIDLDIKGEILRIVDSVEFDVDESLDEVYDTLYDDTESIDEEIEVSDEEIDKLVTIVMGVMVIIVGVVAVIVAFIVKKVEKNKQIKYKNQ